MRTTYLLTSILIAGSVLSTPTLAQQRKTLFQVLFPKQHERIVEKRKAEQKRLQQQALAERAKNLPKVKKIMTYIYKPETFTAIKIKPNEVEVAAILPGEQSRRTDSDGVAGLISSTPNLMTLDLEAMGGKPDVHAETHIAKAVAEYYSKNQNYVWLNEAGDWNARARSIFKILEGAGADGLDPDDYKVEPNIIDQGSANAEAQLRLDREVGLTAAALRYSMDLEYGAINPNLLSGYHSFPNYRAKTSQVLNKLMGKELPARILADFEPDNPQYLALKSELANLTVVEDDIIDLPAKILIKPGMQNEHWPAFVVAIKKRSSPELKAKYSELLNRELEGTQYSEAYVPFVKAYQKEAGLGADGVIGNRTAARLAGLKSQDKIDRVKLAMERMRWLPNQLGTRYVFVNQPEYRARYINNGKEALSMRVVVGKKSNQTNFFYDEIEHVVMNPYWGVPRSIIVNEFLPKSLANPSYLDEKGYEVTTYGGKKISSSSIDWGNIGTKPNFVVRQPPSTKNALGELKIMFPNKHSIYMHDTPSKSLFKKTNRAFSHGCIRLHDPRAMAAAVLGQSKKQVGATIATGKNQTVPLKTKIPVYISYFTAWPDKDGKVRYFSDMYGRDSLLKKALETTENSRKAALSS